MPLSKRSFILFFAVAALATAGNRIFAATNGNTMNWVQDLATAQTEAVRSGKLILIHFSGEACAPCVRVEKNVFSQASVGHQINSRFVPVYINATAQPHIARQFQVASWPTDLVVSAAGQELHRMTSPQDPRAYLAELGKSIWRAQSLGPSAAPSLAMGQRETPTGQTPRQTVAQEKTPQQRVAQATTLPPSQRAPNIYQQAIQSPIAGAQQSATYLPRQTPITRPTPFVQQVAAAQYGQQRPVANAAAQSTSTMQAAVTAATNTAAAVQPVVNQQRAAFARPIAGQQQPANPAADLYPPSRLEQPTHQLQTHFAATQTTTQASRIPASPHPAIGVQRASFDQTATPAHNQQVAAQLPPGQNPFDGTTMQGTSTGPVMLNNPFMTNNHRPAAQAMPTANPAGYAREQQQQQYIPPAYQPSSPPSRTTAAPASGTPPTPPTPRLAAPSAGIRTANIDPTPTPALTPASPQPVAAQPPAPPTTSPSAPENVAMDGFCCVTLHHEDKWVKGDPSWGAQHRGKIFLFHSAGAQERFLSDPDKYSPLLSGYDPVVFHQTGELKSGFRAHGVRYQDMTCLFSSEESLKRFWESPWQFTQTASLAMRADTAVR